LFAGDRLGFCGIDSRLLLIDADEWPICFEGFVNVEFCGFWLFVSCRFVMDVVTGDLGKVYA
jgi:hypothetical protein